MRWLASICALFIGMSVSGCALIEAEKDNRGGLLDQAADRLWMKADSKKMRALRAVAIEASLARIAMIAPKSAPDRALLARRIGETSKRADVVRKCAFLQTTSLIRGQRPDEPCFFFDSVMVDYENALFDLALVALPIDDAKNLITRVSGGIASISANPMELVQALVDLGRDAFRYGRVVGAIYRDTMELEVQVWLASPQFANDERTRGMPEEFVVTNDRVAGLRAAYVRGNDNIPAWRAEIAALRADGLEPVPHSRFILEVYSILTYICGQIVNEKDPAFAECTQPALITNFPVVSDVSLFGPIKRGAGTGAGFTPQQGTNRSSSSGTRTTPDGGSTVVLSSRDILRNLLITAGSAETRLSARNTLQKGLNDLLSTDDGKKLLPAGLPTATNLQIETVVSTRRPEMDFEDVRKKLLEIARANRLIP
jgi:hypothetical protein